MGLLLWQNNLGAASVPANFGTAVSVPAKQQTTPQRSSLEFVIGRGFFTPEMSTTATQPLLGEMGNVPQYPYVFAVDQTEAETISIPVMNAGATGLVNTYLGFTLPTISLDPTDEATMLLIPDVWLDPVVSGLVISSVQLTPQALTTTSSTWNNARSLQGGLTYTAWRMQVTVGLVAVTATQAATLHIAAQALVTVLPQ